MKRSNVGIWVVTVILAAAMWTTPDVAAGASCMVANTIDVSSGSPPVPDSLRDCLTRSGSGDTITFDPNIFDLTNSNAATTITVLGELPALDDGNVTIEASDRRVTVNGSAAGSARGLVISSDGNQVRGLTIEGFPDAGLQIAGAGNVIGGSRTTGVGPNGQGLRISGNGTYGIEILGAGTTANVVKGCWIGLDGDGFTAAPNHVGVTVRDGAAGNTIGGPGAGDANVISGNQFEGVTFSGTGTDSNVVIGNVIGETGGVDSSGARAPRGNGSSGVFLSRGTATRIGGSDPGEANTIANNGGSGIEVRAMESRKNSATQNRISRNKRGGIALFDNANDGIAAPRIISVQELGPTASGTGSTFRIKGSTPQAGAVEVFNDTGSQGETFVTRTVGNGSWSADVDVDHLLNLTATVTDAVGNTSEFGLFGIPTVDADSDGAPDAIEELAGTDPGDPLDAPAVADTPALDVAKMQIGLNFAKSGKDAIALTARMTLPPFAPATTVGIYAAGHAEHLVLDAKGKGASEHGKVALKTSKKTGPYVQYGFKNATLQVMAAPFGLTNETTPKAGVRWVMPVVIAVGKTVYSGTVTLTYKATQGKTGKAKK